jgi:hypothetical protein
MSETHAARAYPDESADTQERIQEKCNDFGLYAIGRPFRVITQHGKKKLFLSAAGYDMAALATPGLYLGADEVEFGPEKLFSKKVNGVLVEELIPEYAKQTVYRYTPNGTAHFTAKIYAREYINDLKHVRNSHMFLDKWVHCVAMRKAFPDILGSEVAAEELDAKMDFSKGDVGTVALHAPVAPGPTASGSYANADITINSHGIVTAAVPGRTVAHTNKSDISTLIEEVFGSNDALGG